MSKKSSVKILVGTLTGLVASETLQKAIFGEYSDGSTRSLADALDGEVLSPRDREHMLYKKKRKKKKLKEKELKKKKSSKKKEKKNGIIDMSL